MKSHLINLLILLTFICSNFIAQDNASHHRKYWWYKSRLNNDFVKIGVNTGESLPFNQRGDNFVNSSVDMKIGDGASTLGQYIALLATEYALLRKNQQNTNIVKNELFCALNAINRLDYKAESITQSGANILNGFFIRDDVPGNFLKSVNNYSHFNYYSDWDGTLENWGDVPTITNDVSNGFHSKIINKGVFKCLSDWNERVDKGVVNYHNIFMSQDQVYNILYGLAFVNKFVPDWETNGGQSFPYTGEISIVNEARGISNRIISHLREPKDQNGNDINASTFDKLVNSWKIKNPLTGVEISSTYGGDARPFAYALGESACLISNNTLSSPNIANLLSIPIACPGGQNHNTLSMSPASFLEWNVGATTNLYIPGQPEKYVDTRLFYTNLSAICNCVYNRIEDQIVEQVINVLSQNPLTNWLGVIIGWTWKIIQIITNTFIPGKYINVTNSSITTNAYNPEAPFDHGPISHSLLHNLPSYIPNTQYSLDYLLDVAPCDGIYNFGTNNQSHFQWSSDNRFDHPNRRGQDAGNSQIAWVSPKGEYNGIDFMLYHNLYYLFQSGPFGINVNMTDLSDIYINQNNFNNTGNVNAYETITTANTTINYTSPTAWRAGKTIYFGSGTTITGNNNLHAYIQKFDCATDYGAFREAGADSTNGNDNNMANDSYAQGVKYHTVNYESETQAAYADLNDSNNDQNLITELPVDEDPIEKIMKASYPDYTKELFVKPTVTIDKVRTYFTMDDNEEAFIHVLDLNGKIIINQSNIKSADSGLTLDFTDFASGTYLLKFTTTKGTNKTQKIIKQ